MNKWKLLTMMICVRCNCLVLCRLGLVCNVCDVRREEIKIICSDETAVGVNGYG